MSPVEKHPTSGEVVFRCAGPHCGQLKGDANHWWLMWPGMEGDKAVLTLCAWDDEVALREGAVHVCGEQCAQRLQSIFMANILEHQSRGR